MTATAWFTEEFWPAYPRKVGKPAALRAFLAISRKTRPCDQEALGHAIMAGLDRYKQAKDGKEPEFIAHPVTWLNQRRWEDAGA